jgi:hypothetical protein
MIFIKNNKKKFRFRDLKLISIIRSEDKMKRYINNHHVGTTAILNCIMSPVVLVFDSGKYGHSVLLEMTIIAIIPAVSSIIFRIVANHCRHFYLIFFDQRLALEKKYILKGNKGFCIIVFKGVIPCCIKMPLNRKGLYSPQNRDEIG